ncbi:polyribonucleotide nucleotidyltransferase, partial [uncultured Allofournierella sp.]
MALEFASKHEEFTNFKTFEMELAGRPLIVETGKMCGLSNGSCLVRYGETVVLCNVTMSEKPRDGIDFFPLSVDFEEKLYAVGRIPGSFMRREGRPGEKAILTSRVVDRPIRPLFPKTMRNDVCVTMTVMSVDQDCSPEITGMIGTSIALSISDIPWAGPIGGVFMGLVDGKLVVNPTLEQREVSDLQLTVAATEKKIVMIEAGANEVDEVTMLNAIKEAHVEIKKIIEFINGIVAQIGKPKKEFQDMDLDHDLFEEVKAEFLDDFKAAMDTDDKNIRDARLLPIREKLEAKYAEQWGDGIIEELMYKMQKFVVRRWLLDEGKRVDGRGINEIRPLAAEVGLLPRVHGSGMFTRGQTQVLTIATLGSTKDSQLMDDLGTEQYKRYMHHYNFPPYSVGEARAPRSPGRREIGHGALAERALVPVLPSMEEFPYTLRLVSEVLSSNGSTSQASICGSTLALMDAGVPIKAPVAGISCGLITEGERWMTMLDIQGV